MHKSATVLTIPQPFDKATLSCAAKSAGRKDAVLRITWRVLSRGFAREIYLREMSTLNPSVVVITGTTHTQLSLLQPLRECSAQSISQTCNCYFSSLLQQPPLFENPISIANLAPLLHLVLEDRIRSEPES